MTEACGIYGLPRKLINFLRQMEKYKESLKWNINEGSHKLSLTMTWSLNKERLSFVDRMKRTLRLNSTWSEEGIEVPKRTTGSFRKKGQRSPDRRCPFCNRALPSERGSSELSWSIGRNSSLNRSGEPCLSPIRDSNFNRSYSVRDSNLLSRSGWSEPRSPARTSTPKKDSESSELHNCSNSSTRSVKLTYRTTEDLELSYEDLFQKAKAETSRQLDSIKREWNKSIRKTSRRNYSSSSSTSSTTDDVINSNGNPIDDVSIPNEPDNIVPAGNAQNAPAQNFIEQGQVLHDLIAGGTSGSHGNITHNDLSTLQRTSIVRNRNCTVPKRLSYSTDIL